MFLPNGTVISFLLKYSPFETHRRAYKECFQERGGYFNSNIAPPHLMARTLRREIVGVLSDDFMAPYRHNFILGKEPLSVGFAGYYYALKLPLKAEIDMVLLVLQSSGILEQVLMLSRHCVGYLKCTAFSIALRIHVSFPLYPFRRDFATTGSWPERTVTVKSLCQAPVQLSSGWSIFSPCSLLWLPDSLSPLLSLLLRISQGEVGKRT